MLAKHYASALNKSYLFPDGQPTYDWFQCFVSRHSSLKLKRSSPLEKSRASLTTLQVDEWFALLTKVIEENNLINCPAQIFNADETGEKLFVFYSTDPFHKNLGFSDAVSASKVIVHRGTSNAYQVQGGSGGKSYTSVMICASATGQLMPPFVVYRSKRLFQEWCLGGPLGAGYATSDK
jgi:hypothetical protein